MEWVLEILREFWAILGQMSPYLLFGFLVAGVLSVVVAPRLVERHLGGRGFWPVLKAAAFGVPLPLCSCGVIPVSASLRKHGAGRGATTAFLISTPQTGVDSILVTFSLLGGAFAIFRPLFALASGIAGGLAVTLLGRNGAAGGRTDDAPPQCDDACCKANAHGKVRNALVYGFYTLPKDIGRALLVGLIVAALISAIIPDDYFKDLLPPGIGQMLILMLAGIPVYVCATASVPIAAALILKGVSPGAALAFLMTGPATNAATIAMVWVVMGRRTAAIYLAIVAVSALGGGLLLDALVSPGAVRAAVHGGHWMLPQWLDAAAAVALLAVLAVALVGPYLVRRLRLGERPAEAHGPRPIRIAITGMTCSHCADSVRRTLAGVPGVAGVEVDLASGWATVQPASPAPEAAALRRAVAELGYGVAEIAGVEAAGPPGR